MSRRLSWIPGVALFQVVAMTTIALGARVQYSNFRFLWQHLSPDAVADDLLGSLLALHIQPPGFNLVLAGIDRFGPRADIAWLVLGLGLASLTIALAADTVRRLTGSAVWGAGVGIALALLPSTVLYALWPAYTILVAALVTLAAWSVVVALTGSPSTRLSGTCLVCSGLSVTALFFVRASFTWLLVLAWIALVLALAVLRLNAGARSWVVTCLLGLFVFISLVQIRSFVTFGLLTQSSWSGQNFINAGLSSGAITVADLSTVSGDDLCLNYLADRAPFTPETPDVSAMTGMELCVQEIDSDAAALKEVRWSNGQYNFNNAYELAWASQWNSLALQVLRHDPLVLPKIITGGIQKPGSLAVLLARSDTYNQVRGNWQAAGALLGKAWPLSVLWGPLVVAVSALGGLLLLAIPSIRRRTPHAFWILWVGSGVLLSIDLMAEHGENQRFRVEIDPLLAIVGACATYYLVHCRRPTSTRNDRQSSAEEHESGNAKGATPSD